MERKVAAFVDAFSATLFAQWTAQPSRGRFWDDAAFLQRALEDGVATVPQRKLQAAVRRDVAACVAQLQTRLAAQHLEFTKQAPAAREDRATLLNEQDVERALATNDDADAVLAREDATATRLQTALETATSASECVAIATECTTQLRVVRARRFEAAEHVEAFYYHLIYASATAAITQWCADARGVWRVATAKCADREALRRAFQSVVAADALAVREPTKPWSVFYRPPVSKVFRSHDLVATRASVYGALLALAVAFPVVYDDDDESDNDTSDESSESDDDEKPTKTTTRREAHDDCATLAAVVVRQVVLAAKREAHAAEWYLAVLAAFHALPKPTQLVYDDEDDDEEALTPAQQSALHDALADLYARAFAPAAGASWWTEREPLALLKAILCLRHAAEFLRVTRQRTVAAVTTAATVLAGVALPSAFWKWMAHVKKVFAGEHAVVQALMKKLMKHKSDKKMANVLLLESIVTLAELKAVVEHFGVFLEAETERAHFVVVPMTAGDVPTVGADATDDAPDQALFFMDQDGGHKAKNKRAAKDNDATTRSKRTRADA